VPQQPPGFQPRADMSGGWNATARGCRWVCGVTGMRGVRHKRKTQLAAACAKAKAGGGWRMVALSTLRMRPGLAGAYGAGG